MRACVISLAWSLFCLASDKASAQFFQITSPTTATATVGGNFTYQITTSTPAISYGATSLPNWLTISPMTGVLSGVAPGAPGVFPVNLTAFNSMGTASRQLTINVVNSTNANLSALSLSNVVISPAFSANTTSYTANVGGGVSSVSVRPTAAQANATIQVRINSGTFSNVASGSFSSPLPLNLGGNTIDARVTAQDNTTTKTYTITVTRAASANADLGALSLSAGTLAPTFSANTTSYTANVGNTVSSITVTPTVADATASLKVNATDVASGAASSPINLAVGGNTITVAVTAQNGTTKNYTIAVERAPNSAPTITAIPDTTIDEDGSVSLPFTIGDTETAAGLLAVEASVGDTSLVPSANTVLGGSGTERTITLTPAPDKSGATTVTVRVGDGTATTSRTFNLTVNAVNDTPVAAPQTVTTPQGTPLAITLTAADLENDATTLTIVSPPLNGTISAISFPGGATGPMRLIYTPRPGFAGADIFTFRGTDTQPGLPAAVNINVPAVVDPSVERLKRGVQIKPAAAGSWNVKWEAAEGAEYVVQRSTDLRTWADAPNGRIIAESDTVNFTDSPPSPAKATSSSASSKGFWRVQLLGSADGAPPVVSGVDARVIALPDGSRTLQLTVGAADNQQVTGVTVMEGNNPVGEGVFSPADGLWKINVPVPSDSLGTRVFSVVARDAKDNRSEEFTQRFGLFDPSRFAPIGQDGRAQRGQPVAAGSNNEWSPFEYRAGGGGARGVGADLVIKFPQGARLVDTPSGPALEFTAASAQFGPRSPLQLRSPLQRTGGTARLPLDTLDVEDLRTAFGVTGEPGLDVVVNGRAPLRWLGGELKPEGIAEPVFAPSASLGWPLPSRSMSFAGFTLDWANSSVRLPFSGTFPLGTEPDAPVLEVPAANPLWLELRGDGSVALRGNARLKLPGGSSIGVEVIADDPLYHLRVRAEGFEIPMADTLADLLPDNPQSTLPPDSGGSTERDVALDNYTRGLTSLRRGFGQFVAATAALDPRLPGANAPILPADEVGAVSSMLEAWVYLGPGAAVPSGAVAPLVDLATRLQNAFGFDRDAGSAVGLAAALGQLRVVLQQNADTTLVEVRNRIAAALPAILEAARLRANDPQMLIDLPALEQAATNLGETALIADAAGLPSEAQALRATIRTMIARYAEEFCRRLGVTAGQYEPSSTINALGTPELEEKLSQLVRINTLVFADDESDLELWNIGTAPLNELGTQIAVALSRKIDVMLTEAERAADINAFLEAAAVKTWIVAQRQLAALPDTPAAQVALDAAGLTVPALETLLGTRAAAVTEADLAQPVEQRSWYDVGRSLERWAAAFAKAPPGLTFSGAVLLTPHRAFQLKADQAIGLLSITGNAADVGRLLRAGTLDARLMRQFPTVLTATTPWENPARLAAVAARLREVAVTSGNHAELLLAAQLMLDEAATLEAEAGKAGLSEADRITRQQTRRIYLQQAALFLDALRDVGRTLWAASKSARAATPGISTDMLLPGNVKIREVRGAFSFHRITGAFRGSVGGKADLPGFFDGAQMEVVNASFTSGGAYEMSLAGNVVLPVKPNEVSIRKVSIPARRPITVGHTPGQPLRVAGSTLVELSNGVFFEGMLSLQDPVYTFGLAAGGARFELARKISGYTTTLDLTRPLQELGQSTLRAFADYQRSLGAAFDPLLNLAAAPVNIPPLGQPPEFAPPELSFDGAALQAWASGLKSNFGLAAQAGYKELSSDLVAALNKAVADAQLQPPGLLENLTLYLQTLRRAEEVKLNADVARAYLLHSRASGASDNQEVITGVHAAIAEMARQIGPLLAQGAVVSDTELAARVVRLALDTEANAQLTGAPNTALQDKVAPFLKATVGGMLASMGFNRETGQLVDTQKFNSLGLYDLREASKRLMHIETQLQLLGDGMILPEDKDDPAKLKRTSPPPNPYAQATALVLRAYRERLVQAWFAIDDPSNFSEYRQIASELSEWASFVPALTGTGSGLPVMTGLTPLTMSTPPMSSDDQDALFRDLANQALGLTVSQSLDATARAEDPLYPLLLEWRRLSNAQFGPEVLAATERELRRTFDALLPSLLANLPPDAGALPTATTILRQFLEIAEAADAFNFQSFLEGVVLPQLPSFNLKFQALADAQKAWWETSNYAGLLLDAYGQRNAQLGGAFTSALESSLRATLLTGQGIAQRIAEFRPDEVRNQFDLELPGDIIVRRVGGEFTFNRETQAFLAKLRGDLEFPELKSNKQPLLLGTEGTLNSAGRMTLGFDVRNLRIDDKDDVRLDLKGAVALSNDGNITMDSTSGASKLYVRNRNPGRQPGEPEFYEYAATLAYSRGSNGSPGRFTVTGSSTQPLVFDKNFAVFLPNLAMEFVGEDNGKLAVGGDLALWTAGRDYAPVGPSSTDYQLVFGGGAMEFSYDTTGFALALRRANVSPNLRLALAPALFGEFASPVVDSGPVPDKPANAPLTQIIFGGNPEFRLRYNYGAQGQDGTLRFTAVPPDALTVTNFGFAVPGVPEFALAVKRADLELPMESTSARSERTTQRTFPILRQLDARLRVPLPDSLQGGKRKVEVRISGQEWGLDGRPPGGAEVALDQQGPLHLFNETGVVVSLEPDSALSPPLGLGFTSETVGSNQRTTVTLSGKIRLTLADGVLSNDTTDQSVSGAVGGKLGLAVIVKPDGSVDSISPVAELGTLELAGRFRLGDGNSGFLVRGIDRPDALATLRFGGLGNLLNLSRDKPFTIGLTGAAEVPGLFAFTLNNASLKFIGPGGPLFGVTEVALAAPSGGDLLQLLQGTSDANLMPLTISKVGFGLNNPSLPIMNGAFAPTNLKFILSGGLRLNLPGFDSESSTAPSIKGDVADLTVSFPNGFTNLPSVSANMVRLTLQNLAIGDMAGITGGLAVANLTDPANLLLAGEAGASFNGAGIKLLIAAGRDGLIGVCLSADARPAGIPIDGGALGGVLLTGAEGGIKFRGGASDPTEFESYLRFASDGTPSYQPPTRSERSARRVSTVSDAVAITWEELALLQEQHEAARASGSTEGLIKTEVAAPRTAKTMSTVSTSDPYDCDLGPIPPTAPPDEVNDAVTIKLSGTFSHAAVSTVLTLTGGMLGATDGTFAADGSMNLMGIPAGTAEMWFSPNLDGNGIPNPSLCGNAFLGVGPLQIGEMELLLECDDCISGVVQALGNFAVGIGNSAAMRDFVYKIIDESRGFAVNTSGQLVAKSPVDRSRPLSDYLGPDAQLTPEEQMAVMTGILNVQNLLTLAPSRLPESARNEIVNQAKELVFALNEAVAPRFSFCGSVAPSLFGFPLSGVGEVLGARAEFRRIRIPEETGPKFDEFTTQLRFSPSWLMLNSGFLMAGIPPFLPGFDKADMGFSLQTPTVTRQEIDLLFTNAPAFVEGRAQKVLENSIATFGYELSPFGIRLGNGEARIIFPALASHPLNPARSPAWSTVRPPLVSDGTKLSRTELLLLASDANKLSDPFWRGRAGDLDNLLAGRTQLFNQQPIPAGLSNNLATQDLVRDYFPYGGVLAAGSVNFPNFIASAPPLDQLAAVFTPPADPAQFSGWWANANNLWTNYVTGTTEVGSAAIYLPAPNPPGLWSLGTNNNPKNLELLQALRLPNLDSILNPNNPQRTELYAFNEILLQGYVAPKFFGLPVGRGRINLVDGRLEVTASADTGSWLAELAPTNGVAPGAAFELKFMIEQPRYLEAKAGTRPTNSAAATAPSPAAVFSNVVANINPANASAKVAELLDTLPRTSFETKVAVDFPPELQQFLGASGNAQLNLYGFSFGFEPNYDPRGNTNSFPLPISTFDPVNPDPYTVARRQGGVGLAGQLNFTAPGFTLTNVAAALSLSAGQADNLFPRLKSQFTAESVALPGGFVFEQARVTFDSAPAVGGDIFRMGGLCSPINLAPFLVVRPPTSNLAQPIGANERLGGDLRVTKTGPNPNDVGTSLSLRPAQVYCPLLGVVGQISGANPADDFTFSSVPGTPWAARLELGGALLVRNPANMVINPTNPLSVTGDVLFQVELAGEGKLSATVEGVGLDEITMRVALPNGAKLTAFPGQKTEAKWVLGSDNTSCLLVKIKKDSTTGLPVLHQLYYDSGTVELNLAEAAVDTNGVRQPLMQVTGRVEFGIEPASLAAQLGTTPTSLTLPSTAVDRVSTNSFAVTNTGNAQLVLDASVTNNTTEFQVAPVRAVIPPGGATNFVVTFSPTAGGSRSAGLRLDAPRNATTRSVSLTGTATATASNNVTPSTLAFGEVERGRFLDRSIVVSNPGLAPLTVSNATVTAGRFSVVDTLPFTVPPRGQRTLLVRYEPNSAETSSNTLTITTSAGNANVGLTGTGTQRLWYLQRRGERTLNAVAFALTNSTGNVFGMAVGNAGEVVVSSDSGRSWAPVDNLADATLHDVVLRGDVTTGRITSGWLVGDNAVYQHNGVDNSWTRIPDFDSGGTKTILPAGVWRGAASRTNDGRVAIVGADASGRGLAGSSPAAPLTDRWPTTNGPTASLFKPLNDVIETGGSFFAVGEDTEQLESTDGITWTRSSLGFQQSLPITTDFHAIARGGTATNAVWLIVGEEGLILHRFDNESVWTKLDFSSLTGARMLRGVTIYNNSAIIVGEGGLILRLTLGTTSSNRASPVAEISEATRTLQAVATVSSQLQLARFVAVGRGGEIHHRDSNLPGATLAAVQVPDSLVLNTGNSGLLFRTIEVRNPTASASTYTLTAPSSLSLETNSVTLAPGEAQNVLVTYNSSASSGADGSITVNRGATTVATIPVDITEQSGMWQQVGWPAKETGTSFLGFPSSIASTTAWLGTSSNAYVSTDNGFKWTKIALPTNRVVEAGHFAEPDYGVVGQSSVAAFFANDSTPVSAAQPYTEENIAMDSEVVSGTLNGLALARSKDSAVLAAYSEKNKALIYTNLSLPSTATSLVDVARRGAFHVMSTNRVFSRATNATSWTTNLTSSDTLSDLFALDASNIWAAGQNSTLYRLSAGNWAKQTAANIDGDFIAIAFSSTNQGFAILDRGDGRSIVSISTNAGASWADEFSLPTSLGRLTHVTVSPQSSNALVSGDNGQLWRRVAAATRTPNYAYAAAQVRFGSEAIGGRSTATLTVRNPGTQPYSITAADFADASSPFSYDFTNDITVPAGGTANLTVVYRPRTPGIHTDRLRLTTSAANGFIEVEVTGQAERRAATILVDTQPSGLLWRLGTNGTLARGPRVFEVVEGTPGANQVRIGDNLVVGTVASDTLASRNYRFREWRGSSDLVYSQPVTPAGGQVFARFERQLPTPPEHSVPAPVAATRCEDLVVPAGVGPGPWLRISDATLTLRGLDATERFRSEGALYLSLREAYGSLRNSAWTINAPEGGELLAATASSWRFLLRADRLELETETPGLRVLSRPLAPATHFVLTAAVGENLGDSRIEGSFTLLDDANLLPGVVQFRSGSGVLFRLQTSLFEVRPYLRLDGTVRLLQTPFTDDGWLFESPYNLEVGNPAAISPTEEVTLVDVGLLKVVRDAQSRFQVGVNATNGAVGLQVGGLRTDFLGGATFRAPLASVDTSGRLEITMDSDLPLGPVYLDRTDSSASAKLVVDTRALGFSLSTPAMAVKPAVPVAYVDNQGESLWPETAWVLPAQSIDLLQDFEWRIDDEVMRNLRFGLWQFGEADRDSYLIAERKDGIFGLRFRSYSEAIFGDLDVRLRARMNGQLGGRAEGKLQAFGVEFGRGRIGFSPTRSTYQFSGTLSVLGLSATFDAGTTSSANTGGTFGARIR